MSTNLTARAWREGRWWVFEIPELVSVAPSGETIAARGQSRTLRDLESEVHDVAALWLNLDDYADEIPVTIDLPDDVAELWREANESEARARDAVLAAAELRREAVRALVSSSGHRVSQADAAIALHLSRQRINQLAR